MDSYQPLYDATRSRISPCDTTNVIERVAYSALDFSHARAMLQDAISTAGYEYTRPSVLFRPAVYPDGNQWCALYGANLQEGVAGFGESPALACEDFDKRWHAKTEAISR